MDGWIAEQETVIEFHGDYFHGNPDKYAPTEYNTSLHSTFGDLYDRTLDRMRQLFEKGYTILYVWEKDFVAWEKGPCFSALPIRTFTPDRPEVASEDRLHRMADAPIPK